MTVFVRRLGLVHVALVRQGLFFACLIPFALHIRYDSIRLGNRPVTTAAHAAFAVALGAFFFAAAAVVHEQLAGTGMRPILVLSLVLWPLLTAIPAFLAALAAAAFFGRARPGN